MHTNSPGNENQTSEIIPEDISPQFAEIFAWIDSGGSHLPGDLPCSRSLESFQDMDSQNIDLNLSKEEDRVSIASSMGDSGFQSQSDHSHRAAPKNSWNSEDTSATTDHYVVSYSSPPPSSNNRFLSEISPDIYLGSQPVDSSFATTDFAGAAEYQTQSLNQFLASEFAAPNHQQYGQGNGIDANAAMAATVSRYCIPSVHAVSMQHHSGNASLQPEFIQQCAPLRKPSVQRIDTSASYSSAEGYESLSSHASDTVPPSVSFRWPASVFAGQFTNRASQQSTSHLSQDPDYSTTGKGFPSDQPFSMLPSDSGHRHLQGFGDLGTWASPIDIKRPSTEEIPDVKSARSHPMYQANPLADDMYHCPYKAETGCNHIPTKLKCSYDKYVDSHLKPFRCKSVDCGDLQFSSTACLLRHEREAHAMHGHGTKPHLCFYQDCERSQPGNGFPRRYNLYDHMRRMHDHVELQEKAESPTSSHAETKPVICKRKFTADLDHRPEKRRVVLSPVQSFPRCAPQLKKRDKSKSRICSEFEKARLALLERLQALQGPTDEDCLREIKDDHAGLHGLAAKYKELG